MGNFSFIRLLKDPSTDKQICTFVEFVYRELGYSSVRLELDSEVLSELNTDDLIKSLKYYIACNGVSSQSTANRYVTNITTFFKNISDSYGIKNEVILYNDLYKEFYNNAQQIILSLSPTVSTKMLSDEDYQSVIDYIKKFLSEHLSCVREEILSELTGDNCRSKSKITIYHRFVSVIAIKFIIAYGLKSEIVVGIQMKNINLKNETLSINGINLHLSKDICNLISVYLPIRDSILNRNGTKSDFLFLMKNGKSYKEANTKQSENLYDRPEYERFFLALNDAIGTSSAKKLSLKVSANMLLGGVSISAVSQLTGNKSTAIENILSSGNIDKNHIAEDELRRYFGNKNHVEKKGYIKCPICGKEVKATSEDLIIIKYAGEKIERLSCKYCKGVTHSDG